MVLPPAGLSFIIDKRFKSPTSGVCLLIKLHSVRFLSASLILLETSMRETESVKSFLICFLKTN